MTHGTERSARDRGPRGGDPGRVRRGGGDFRPQSVHEWSPLDRLRLRLLLHNSICPLAYAFCGMFLLTIKPTPLWIWRECSLFALLFQLPGAIIVSKGLRNLGPHKFSWANSILLRGLAVFAIGVLVLQIINILRLNLFWPFFLSIVMHLLAGMIQFSRMVLLLPERE
jgi:hypothetical protein